MEEANNERIRNPLGSMNILLWMQQRHLSCSEIYLHQQIKTVEEES